MQTEFMKAIMILCSYFFLRKLLHNKDYTVAYPERFTFPCM